MYKSRWRSSLVGLTLAALLAAFVWRSLPRERLLLHTATKVWAEDADEQRSAYWIDGQTLLLVTDMTDYAHPPKGLVTWASAWTGKAELLDIRTGKLTSAPGLTHMLNSWHAAPEDCEPHPAGKGLFWTTFETSDHWLFFMLSTRDGLHYYRWDADKFALKYWVNDHIWVVRDVRENPVVIYVYDADKPEACLKLPVDSERARSLIASISTPGFVFATTDDMQNDSYPNPLEIGQFYPRDYYLQNDPEPVHTASIRFPESTRCRSLYLSPDNRHVLYALSTEQTPPLQALLHRLFPSVQVRPRLLQSLWLSRTDGTDLHEIGHIEFKDKTKFDAFHWRGVQWLPDNRRIAFDYHGGIYTVAAD